MFDYIAEYIRSPMWISKIQNFIDDNCLIFDDEELNQLAFTEIHQKFRSLVDELLERTLADIGLTEEQFADSMKRNSRNPAVVAILEELCGADDYLLFKSIMVKRNRELTMKAISALQLMQGEIQEVVEGLPEAEERKDSSELKQKLVQTMQPYQLEGWDAKDMDKDLQTAIQASLVDVSLEQARIEKEQADLEHAIALSLAMFSQGVADSKGMEDSKGAAVRESATPQEKESTSTISSGMANTDSKDGQAENISAPSKTASPQDPSPKSTTHSVGPEKTNPKVKAKLVEKSTQKLSSQKLPSIFSKLSVTAKPSQKEKKELVNKMFDEHRETVKAERKNVQAALSKNAAKTNEDLDKRNEFIRKQRLRLIAKQKAERERKAAQFLKEAQALLPSETEAEQKPSSTKPDPSRDAIKLAIRKRLAVKLKKNFEKDSGDLEQKLNLEAQIESVKKLDERRKEVAKKRKEKVEFEVVHEGSAGSKHTFVRLKSVGIVDNMFGM